MARAATRRRPTDALPFSGLPASCEPRCRGLEGNTAADSQHFRGCFARRHRRNANIGLRVVGSLGPYGAGGLWALRRAAFARAYVAGCITQKTSNGSGLGVRPGRLARWSQRQAYDTGSIRIWPLRLVPPRKTRYWDWPGPALQRPFLQSAKEFTLDAAGGVAAGKLLFLTGAGALAG